MTSSLRQIIVTASLGTLCLVAKADMTAEGNAKVYTGGEGAKVTIVALKPRKANQVLIGYEGTDSELDGKVFLYEANSNGRGTDFITERGGSKKYDVTSQADWYSTKNYEMHRPNTRDAVHIYYNQSKSESADAEGLIARYLGHKIATSKGTAQAFDKDEEVLKEEKTFLKATKSMNSACGSSVKTKIEWTTVKDNVLKEVEVGTKCAAVLNAIEGLCEDNLGKEAVKKGISEVTCQFAPKESVALSGKKLKWAVAEDSANLVDLATVYLGKAL